MADDSGEGLQGDRRKAPRRRRARKDEEKFLRLADGQFTRGLRIIPSTSQNLVAVLGYSGEDETVLVPNVEFGFELHAQALGEEASPDRAYATISAENASFLIADVCHDFARVSEEIGNLCSERCSLDPRRVDYIVQCLARAGEDIARSLATFEGIRSLPRAARKSG